MLTFVVWTARRLWRPDGTGSSMVHPLQAVPQCILQTVAVIVYGETSALNVASILISLIVVASKGYLVAHHRHGATFAFNSLCVCADAFGLFATVCWVFSNDMALMDTSLWPYMAGAAGGLLGCTDRCGWCRGWCGHQPIALTSSKCAGAPSTRPVLSVGGL